MPNMVLTLLHICKQEVSLYVENCIHNFVLHLCLGKAAMVAEKKTEASSGVAAFA